MADDQAETHTINETESDKELNSEDDENNNNNDAEEITETEETELDPVISKMIEDSGLGMSHEEEGILPEAVRRGTFENILITQTEDEEDGFKVIPSPINQQIQEKDPTSLLNVPKPKKAKKQVKRTPESMLTNILTIDDYDGLLDDMDQFGSDAGSEDDSTYDPYEARATQIERLLEDDSLWETDLEEDADADEQLALHDTTGKFNYMKKCEKMGIVPVKYFIQHIGNTELVMRYHGLGPEGTKAAAKALTSNATVEVLDLSGNWMEEAGGIAIGKMIEENSFIQKLVVADNRLKGVGMATIFKGVPINTTLKYLDLSGNELDDIACEKLGEMIENSKSLTDLILRNNNISCEGAEFIGPALAANDFLEFVDLSKNKIRGNGGAALAAGMKENVRIKKLDLSWNGLGRDGGISMSDMLRENAYLLHLDIRGNRLDAEVANALGKSLQQNETLTHLYMGNNPINTLGSFLLISQLEKCTNSGLTFLSLKDIPVSFEFVKSLEKITTQRPSLECEYGAELRVGNTEEDIKKDAVNLKNLIHVLRQHLLVNDLRLIGAIQQFDEEKTLFITPENFATALDNVGIPYKKCHIEEVKKKLDKNGDGNIYYGDFIPPERPQREPDLMPMFEPEE